MPTSRHVDTTITLMKSKIADMPSPGLPTHQLADWSTCGCCVSYRIGTVDAGSCLASMPTSISVKSNIINNTVTQNICLFGTWVSTESSFTVAWLVSRHVGISARSVLFSVRMDGNQV